MDNESKFQAIELRGAEDAVKGSARLDLVAEHAVKALSRCIMVVRMPMRAATTSCMMLLLPKIAWWGAGQWHC
jgi:hypothetical protein